MSQVMSAMLSARNAHHFTVPVNMLMVSQVRGWLRKNFGADSTLVIEGVYHGPLIGTRNRVALRLVLPDAIGEVEVAWLYALREQHLGVQRSQERILAKLREREGERDTRTVA